MVITNDAENVLHVKMLFVKRLDIKVVASITVNSEGGLLEAIIEYSLTFF